MVAEEQIHEDPVMRQRYSFAPGSDEHGPFVEVRAWVQPGGGVPAHVHPGIEERFTVVSGRAQLLSGRRWVEAGPGETVVVPPGTRHAYRNRGEETMHFVCMVRPPSSLQGFLEGSAGLSRAGAITRRGLPTSPGALLMGAVLIDAHKEMVRMGFPLPPPALMAPLAALGRRRGYRAGEFKHLASEDRRTQAS